MGDSISTGPGRTALNVNYDNDASGLTAVNVQDAIDELAGGGGGGGVTTLNGLSGAVVLAAGTNITLTPVGNTITIDAAGGGSGANDTLSNLTSPTAINQDLLPAAHNTQSLGAAGDQFAELHILSIQSSNDLVPDGETGSFVQNDQTIYLRPDSASPNYQMVLNSETVNMDPDGSGLAIGTSGNSSIVNVTQLNMQGANSDIGQVIFDSKNFSIGNGTDPASLEGFQYVQGLGTFNSGAVVAGPINGFSFGPTLSAGSSMSTSAYIIGFVDSINSSVELPSHTSFQAGANIASIANNHNYSGLQINTNIPIFTGNAGFTGIGIFGNLGTFDTGFYRGIAVSPTVTLTDSAIGLEVNMDNVTVTAGAPSVLVIQDLTITASQDGAVGNTVTFEYTPGATAGSEVVSGTFPTFQVQIDSGVSTATQVKAALDGYGPLATLITTAISGVGSNPQVTQAATNMSGGIDPGQKLAARFDGDVQIDGSLSFTGGLSIGALSSFATHTLTSGTGTPYSIDTLITAPSVAASATLTNADLISVNTAMLLTVGDNASVSTSFLGLTALGLPAVVNMGTGSTVDRVTGATFAISLDAAATGGTIAEVDLCRAIGIPNGATTVDRLMGYKMDLPFGDPGTESFGLYITPSIFNYMAGSLKIGGTPGSNDTPANSSVGLELDSTTKAFLPSRMDTTERDALTAVDGMIIYNTTTQTTQAYENGAWVDLSGGGGTSYISAAARLGSNISIVPATLTTIIFDTVIENPDSAYNGLTGEWTAPTSGLISIAANFAYFFPSSTDHYATISINSTNYNTVGDSGVSGAPFLSMAVSLVYMVTAGDIIEIKTQHQGVGAEDINAGMLGPTDATYFSVTYL